MSRPIRALLALAALLALVVGGATAPATAALPPGYGAIAGVVRGPGGTPVAGVTVTAMEVGRGSNYLGAEVTTDAAGRFRMEVQEDEFDLRAFDRQARFATADVFGVRVRSGATTTRDLTVQPGLTLTGRVSRADGGPVAGIAVFAGTPDPRESVVERGATVSADGTYTVRGLHPATWRVLVDPYAATDARLLAHDLEGRPRPDRDWGIGTPVRVTGDGTGGQALPAVTLRHRTPVVTGVVRGVGGRPVAGVTVHTDDENWWLDDGEGDPYPGIGDTTGADGRYELRLAEPGRTMPLQVSTGDLRDDGYADLPFRVAVPAIDGRRTVDVRLRSAATVTPTVTSTRKASTVRVVYRPRVAGANRVAAVTVRYKATNGKARKVRGTLGRDGVLTLRLTKIKRGSRTVKVHVAGNADAAPVTRTIAARIR